jgi:hypothetical protein
MLAVVKGEKMKKMICLLSLTLSSCGTFTTGDGTFDGTLVDVSWEGLMFKSCEASFQYGQQSSSISKGSSRDKKMCDRLSEYIGKRIKVKYQEWVRPCCMRTSTAYEILVLVDE